MLLTPDSRPLIHGYGEDLDVQVPSYRLEEIIAEKMRSLLQTHKKLVARGSNRPRACDYYDLWRLFTAFNNEIDRAALPALLKHKCAHRDVAYASIGDSFTDQLVTEAQTHWESNLRPFVTNLPDCDVVLNDLESLMVGLLPELSG